MADLFRGDGEQFWGEPEKMDWTEAQFSLDIWGYERIDKKRFVFTHDYDKDVFFVHDFHDDRTFLDWYKANAPFYDEDGFAVEGTIKLRGTLHYVNRVYPDEMETFEKSDIADFAESLYYEITKRTLVANALRKRLEKALELTDNAERDKALEDLSVLIKKLKNLRVHS